MIMSNTTTYRLIRTGIMIAIITGSASACHYKAGEQYVNNDDVPGADSGTRRVSTTTMRSDSTNMPTDSTATKPADTTAAKPGSASKTHPTSMAMPSKFTHGHASVTAPKIYTTAEVAPVFPGGQSPGPCM